MAVTAQQVFDQAIHLMDEQNEPNGLTITNDTNEYRFRTISILNTVMPSLYPYSDTCVTPARGRPVCPQLKANHSKPDLNQPIPLDDTLALGVLPYALAAHLLSGENEELSQWFLSRYNQTFGDLRSRIPASLEPITPAIWPF